MKARCYLFSGLLCLTLFLTLNATAETYGQPQLKIQQLVLGDNSKISTEIMSGQIITVVKGNLSSSVKLSWVDDAFSATAHQLRDSLIRGGIAPENVLLQPQSGGFNTRAVSGITIEIQQIVLRLPECNYSSQNYRFDIYDNLGCALNNTRSISIINPYKFNF